MKLRDKLKNKKMVMALAGLVGMAGLMAAPLSEAGIWFHWHVGPRHAGYRWHHHHRHFRRVWVRRDCRHGHCHVRRWIWVR